MRLISSFPITASDARWLFFEKIVLNPWNEPVSINGCLPDPLVPHNLKVVKYVFLTVEVAEFGHSIKARENIDWNTGMKIGWRVHCKLFFSGKQFRTFRRVWMFNCTWFLSTKNTVKFQPLFEKKTKESRGTWFWEVNESLRHWK